MSRNRGLVTQSTGVANGIATATVAAIEGVQHIIHGVEAHYDVDTDAVKTITVKHGSTTFIVFRPDFNNGEFKWTFPNELKGDPNEAVTVALEASGAGGTTGYVSVWHST